LATLFTFVDLRATEEEEEEEEETTTIPLSFKPRKMQFLGERIREPHKSARPFYRFRPGLSPNLFTRFLF
jgi:hypothetical protein